MPLPYISNGIRARTRPLISAITSQRRAYNVAVVGGGITGLTAAWKLMRDPKCTGITLYEKSHKFGGWMESEEIPVGDGKVVFEYGPRTLKWTTATGECMMDMEPLLRPIIPAVLFEHTKPARMPDQWQKDESVSHFISRRFNSQVADNIVSAVMHGIYAGDIDKLSAQTLLGPLRNLEGSGIMYSMIMRAWNRTKTLPMDDSLIAEETRLSNSGTTVARRLPGLCGMGSYASTFTFKGGTKQLIDGLVSALRKSDKVNIKTQADIQTISHQPGNYSPMEISTSESRKVYDHVIAAIPAPALTKILAAPPKPTNHPNITGRSSPKLPSDTIQKLKSFDYATTVMVINLYYSNPNLLSINGFGYLIPRSTPASENPECGLGVIFATESSSGEELGECEEFGDGSWKIRKQPVSQDTAKGTKLTVMMGGHYWDHFRPGDYPDHETAVSMACKMLERHLGVTEKPTIARSRLQQDAIPQYTVGHLDRMYELSKTVKRDFDQRLVLAGNWYNGVGVGDCIKQGIMAATYGVGFKLPPRAELRRGDSFVVHDHHLSFDYENWDMQGGIPTAPVRIVDVEPQ
ncbi:unnamed protein product [Penicillium pancosmium]